MPLTRGFTDEIKGLNAEPITGSAESELLDDTLSRIAKHIDSPVRLYASETPDENLNIGSNVVESGDGSGEVAPPIEYNTGAFVGGVVSFQAKTATATIKVDGGAFSFPAGTVGDYRRLAVALQSDGTVDCTWSDAFGSVPALPNPGSMFAVLSGIAYGYVDLECTDVVGKYKTIGSADPVIENKVGSNIRIFRFSSSSAVAGLRTDFNKFVGSGVGPGWYPTIADATPTDGDRILVVEGYELDATETWAFSNVTIVFMPNQKLTSSAATTSAIVISGSGNRIYDLWSLINIASSLTNGLVVSGTDNQVYGVTVEAGNAGLTLTNAVSLTGQRNTVIGDRLVTAGAITYKIGTTATDSAALISGSFQNPEGEPEFTKYVGTKPANSDGKNWYTTIALATPTGGDRILVTTGYSLAATETWAFNNVTIVFMPYQQLTFTAATTSALIISGNGNKIYDLWTRVNIASSLTNGLVVSGTDNHLYGVTVEAYNAGLTLTNAVSLTGQRNTAIGDRLVTSGAITNKIGTTATDSAALISGSFQNPEGEPEFTKYVGTKPTNSDGKNWFTTLAIASPAAGDRILVVTGYSIAATETWSFSDVTIVFMPNQQLTFTAATTSVLIISGNRNRIYDLWVKVNIAASLTNGISLAGLDNHLYGVMVEGTNAGLTLTNAFDLSGQRNLVVGDRLATAGAITNKIGTTATDSAALVSGSFQNPEGEPEFTKYVGTKPTNSDGKNWYTTIALATPTAGDRILVVTGYSLAATETWSFSDAIIIFMPNQKLTFTGATTNALVISGNNNAFYDMYLLLNLSASLTNGVLLSGNDNSLVNVTVESGNSGLTVTNAFNATGLRNNTVGDRKISTGIIQKEVADATQVFLPGTAAGTAVITAASTTGVVAGMTVSGKWIPAGSVVISFVVNTSITINQNASGSGATVLYFSSDNLTRVSCHINTNMYDVGGFARISSPTQSVKGAGNESLDCSAQHIFYKTGGAATIELLNLNEGQTVNVVMASTGSDYSITWSPVPKWATATQPVETIAASKYDFYTFIKIGGMVFGSAVLNMS